MSATSIYATFGIKLRKSFSDRYGDLNDLDRESLKNDLSSFGLTAEFSDHNTETERVIIGKHLAEIKIYSFGVQTSDILDLSKGEIMIQISRFLRSIDYNGLISGPALYFSADSCSCCS